MSINIKKHLSLLGLKVRCRVTGFEGIVETVSFDLYGCIQAVVNPGIDKDGKRKECMWMDVSRLEVLTKKPVMQTPNFDYGPVAEGNHGPADKPPRY